MRATYSKDQMRTRKRMIFAAVVSGTPAEQVASDFGITTGRVYHVCREYGLVLRQARSFGHNVVTAERKRQVVLAAGAGETTAEIAARLGVSKEFVWDCCRAAGVKVARSVGRYQADRRDVRRQLLEHLEVLRRKLRTDQIQVLRDLRDPSASITSVARRHGMTRSAVNYLWCKASRELRRLRGEPVPRSIPAPPALAVRRKRSGPGRSGLKRSRIPKTTQAERAARRRELGRLVASGLSPGQAARRFRLSTNSVYSALRETGITTNDILGDEQDGIAKGIAWLAAAGRSLAVIAERLDEPPERIKRIASEHGIRIPTRYDRIEELRRHARKRVLADIDPQTFLDGNHVEVLRLLREGELTLLEIGRRLDLHKHAVFEIWKQALHRIAVPPGSSYEDFLAARRRVFTSGFSLHALCEGKRCKLVRAMKESDSNFSELARKAGISRQRVFMLWMKALDRAALASVRSDPSSASPRRRVRKVPLLMRDLGL
jgi:DNA-binding CsgD family transcriptional regulator